MFYIHTDQIDTPRLITNSNNSAVWRWDSFDAFGDNPPNDDPNLTGLHFIYNPRFAGQYFDQETRLSYNYFRDYDMGTGRYIQSDPIGLTGGLNTYSYALSNPLGYTDRLGLVIGVDDAAEAAALCAANPACDAAVEAAAAEAAAAASEAAEATAQACKVAEKASEKMARDIAKRIERDLGKDARREFHDMEHLVDRTAAELRADAQELYEAAGKAVPGWLK